MSSKKSASRKSSVSAKKASSPTATVRVPRKKVLSQSDHDAFILARYNTLPYSNTTSGPGASLSTAHHNDGVLSRLGSYIFGGRGGSSHPRIFPYHVQGGQVQFFATDSAALRPFNVSHGDRMRYGIGPMKGYTCSVVGLRAGRLWVVNDSKDNINGTDGRKSGSHAQEVNTRPIAVPLYGACEKDHKEEYMMTKVGSVELALEDIDGFISTIPDAVLGFLRYAPDLVLQLHNGDGSDSKEVCTTYMAPTYNPETRVAGWSGADLIMNFSAAGVRSISGVGVATGCCCSKNPPLVNGDSCGNEDDNNNDDEGNEENYDAEKNTVDEEDIEE